MDVENDSGELKRHLCSFCGNLYEVESLEMHEQAFNWHIRATKKSGYMYTIAARKDNIHKAFTVSKAVTRGLALKAARQQTQAKGVLYELAEVRIITVTGEVVDRFYLEGNRWRHSDVRKIIYGEEECLEKDKVEEETRQDLLGPLANGEESEQKDQTASKPSETNVQALRSREDLFNKIGKLNKEAAETKELIRVKEALLPKDLDI